jgi:hypothetical protein
VPVAGQSVTIQCGDTDVSHQLFGGRIIAVNKTYEAEKPANVIYRCNAIDPTWLLNRRKVTKKYTSQSATAIALDVISSFTSGVTTVNVAAGLATIDEITFTNEEVTDALTRIVERIGGYWYIDYSGDLHLFLSETVTAFPITTAAPRGMAGITNNEDLSQAATRVIARGGGANVVSDVLVGGATVPVGDISWYAGGGGTVECGPQRITYTGVSTIETGSSTGFVNPPPLQTGLTPALGRIADGWRHLPRRDDLQDGRGRDNDQPEWSVTLGGARRTDLVNRHRADRSEDHTQDCLRLERERRCRPRCESLPIRHCEHTRPGYELHRREPVAALDEYRRLWKRRHGGWIDDAPSRRSRRSSPRRDGRQRRAIRSSATPADPPPAAPAR